MPLEMQAPNADVKLVELADPSFVETRSTYRQAEILTATTLPDLSGLESRRSAPAKFYSVPVERDTIG